MKIKIISTRPAGKYKIFVSFNDGTEGIYDLSDVAGQGEYFHSEKKDAWNL